jgi:hypothetical protein
VVAKSPLNATPALNYERGWNAINELIRSDFPERPERNVFYANNHDGTFSTSQARSVWIFPTIAAHLYSPT